MGAPLWKWDEASPDQLLFTFVGVRPQRAKLSDMIQRMKAEKSLGSARKSNYLWPARALLSTAGDWPMDRYTIKHLRDTAKSVEKKNPGVRLGSSARSSLARFFQWASTGKIQTNPPKKVQLPEENGDGPVTMDVSYADVDTLKFVAIDFGSDRFSALRGDVYKAVMMAPEKKYATLKPGRAVASDTKEIRAIAKAIDRFLTRNRLAWRANFSWAENIFYIARIADLEKAIAPAKNGAHS